ncbi:MAG: HTTM domain-containing protein [Chloroflexota bacterium]
MARLFQPEYNFIRREYWFGEADSRPLSLFRIVFSILLVKEALYHLPLAALFYTDAGILPRAVIWDSVGRTERFSLMDALSTTWMAQAFFLLWMLVAISLLLGYRTRLMTIANFIIILSVHERNVYLLTGADTVLRVFSFWAMFLTLDQHYALDTWLSRLPKTAATHAARPNLSSSTTAWVFPWRILQIQIVLIYLVTGLLKLNGQYWQEGEALYSVLQLNSSLLPLGRWLGTHSPYVFLQGLTYGVMLIELSFTILVFAPIAQPILRRVGLVTGASLHIGIALTMAMPITDFSLVMLTGYIVFFEPQWVQSLVDPIGRFMQARGIRQRFTQRATMIAAILPPAAPTFSNPKVASVLRYGMALLMILLIGLVIYWNLQTVEDYTKQVVPPVPALSQAVIWYSGLWQYWDLFAPLPFQIDGWVTIPAEFEDGTTLDLRTGKPATSAIPDASWGPSSRWKKFEENMNNDRNDVLLRAWARYYCRHYYDNLPTGNRLKTFQIHFLYRRVHHPGEPENDIQDDLLWSHQCDT